LPQINILLPEIIITDIFFGRTNFMNDDKWKDFERTGSISDYLSYKGIKLKNGDANGNADIQRDSDP
jgi:hypothetical protein